MSGVMKQALTDVCHRFLTEHGDRYRFLYRRWWHLDQGAWVRGGRDALEQDLVALMWGSFFDLAGTWTRSDMNQMCAYLSLRLECSGLPAARISATEDQRIMRRVTVPETPQP